MLAPDEKIENMAKMLLDSFEQINSFYSFSESMSNPFDTEKICALLLQESKKIIKSPHAEVFLKKNGSEFTSYFIRGKEKKVSAENTLNLGKTLFGTIIKGIDTHLIVEKKTEILKNFSEDFFPVICVPIKCLNKIEGLLCLARKADGTNFTTGDLMFLQTLSAQGTMAIQNSRLLKNYKSLFISAIRTLTEAIDSKDTYTSGHSRRVTEYAITMAKSMNISNRMLKDLELSSLLHDIGKIGIPENLLNKSGRLSPEEYEILKQHPRHGVKILSKMKGFSNVITSIKHHHERYDGAGYPDGLKGEKIPLFSRILAIADTYDAMTSNRSYRNKSTHKEAVEEIVNCSEKQYDPRLVEVFRDVEKTFCAIEA